VLAQKKTSFLAYAQLATNRMARIKNKHSQDENQARSSEFELVWFPFKNTLIDLLNHSHPLLHPLVLEHNFLVYEALKQEVSARVGVGAEAGAGDASNQL